MATIQLEPVVHGGEKRIAVRFAFDAALTAKVKSVPGRLWSRTLNCWHVPYNQESYQMLVHLFGKALVLPATPTGSESQDHAARATAKPPLEEQAHTNEEQAAAITTTTANNQPTAEIAKKLPCINLKPVFVHRTERIAFAGTSIGKLEQQILRKLPGAKWDAGKKYWHVPLNEALYKIIKEKTDGLARLQTDELRQNIPENANQ